MEERGAGELRYKAFLSYSHRDSAIAARLHRRLETYRMPRRLVGSSGARGPVPDRLWPIFRDRDELPAATDLSETVREALAQSGSLIILCSSNSAGSLWVAEEIETFRNLYPDRPILAAIIEGDPPGCFPAALRAFGRDGTWHEPLATDLRPEGDGPHLGLLKLVAGITGVGLDALVQRDASRRIRRVTAVTVAALVAMLMMAALTLVALNARSEAEHQRAQAESLVEFMLTDLRERLRGVGRLDVLTAVNQRALAFYGGQLDLGGLSADSLMRRSRVLHAMGEDDVARGNMDSALAAFAEAHRTTAAQLERSPNDVQSIFTHAQSEYWIGRVHELGGRWPAAHRQFALYAAAAERLIAIAPDNPDHMMEAAYAAQNVGVAQLYGFRDAAAAQGSFEAATRWFERAAVARPADPVARRQQANALAYLADSFYVRRLWRESLASRLQQHRIIEALYRADRDNVENVYRLAAAERAVGLGSALVGDPRNATAYLRKAHERSQWLTMRDPDNAEWLLFRTKVECDLLAADHAGRPPVEEARLLRSVARTGAALGAQRNPRLGEVDESCLRRARLVSESGN